MSVRPLDDDDGGGSDATINTIENMADTKGIDLDDIEVVSGTNDDGDDYREYRIYETRGEDDVDSVAIQVTKMVDSPLGEQTFRQELQRKMSALKKHVSSGDGSDDMEELEDARTEAEKEEQNRRSRQNSPRRGTQPAPRSADGIVIDPNADGVEVHIHIDESEYDGIDAFIRESDSYGALDKRVSKIENALESLGEMFKIPGFGDSDGG